MCDIHFLAEEAMTSEALTIIPTGSTDIWFTFSHDSLPNALAPTAQSKILEHQHLVMSKMLQFESSSKRKHVHFAHGEPLPYETMARLGVGAHAHVDKVMSTVSHRIYARKLFRRHRGIDKDSLQSFLVELQVLKKVEHYHCVELVSSVFTATPT